MDAPGRLRSAPIATPIGRLWIAASAGGVVAIERWEAGSAVAPLPWADPDPEDPVIRAAARELAEYFAGTRRRFDVPVDLAGQTPFRRRVLAAVLGIGYGDTASYADVAADAGAPRAARAVGSALRACPIAVIVPCHRVVAAGGGVGGWGGDPWVKRYLLDHEAGAAAQPVAGRRRQPAGRKP